MDLRRCNFGHLFDPSKHMSCPFCGVPDLNIGKTRPKRPEGEQEQAGGAQPAEANPAAKDVGKTVGALRKKIGVDPVVGWLVCVKGADRGQDYRIRSERNFIGRSKEMDICIAGDSGISRERHAIISYNPLKNAFRIAPGESSGLVYLNGEDVETPAELKPYDRIQLGETEMVFIPFCGETFQWE